MSLVPIGILPKVSIGVDVTLAEDVYSKWNAVHNPIIHQLQRKDIVLKYTRVDADDLFHAYFKIDTEEFAEVEAGDYVYADPDDDDFLPGTFIVTEVTNQSNIIVELPEGYTDGTFNDGFINLLSSRKNYYVECIIGLFLEDGSVFTPIATTRFTPSPIGVVEIDPHAWLAKYVSAENEFGYDDFPSIWVDDNLSACYRLRYTEIWDGSDEESNDPAFWYFSNSAKQIRNQYGGNMGDFIPYSTVDLPDRRGKFLQFFLNPTFYTMLPFDMAFICSLQHVSNPCLRISEKDINLASTGNGTNDYELDKPSESRVVRFILPQPSDSSVAYLGVRIAQLADQDIEYTETINVRVIDELPCNPIYLAWLNTAGGWSYRCFSFNQFKKLKTGDAVMFAKYLTDIENAESALEFLGKRAFPSMVIGCDNLPIDDYPALEQILYSPKVQWLSNPTTWEDEGLKWITCLVETGSFNTLETRDQAADIELTIQFPEINIQTQ